MMKNIKKFALTLLGCAVLTACGSGGNKTVQQSIDQSKAKTKETLQKIQQQSEQKADQAKQKANNKIQSTKQQVNNALSNTSGKAFSVSGPDEKAIAKWNDINQASLTSITVDGTTVAIVPQGYYARSSWISTENLTVCCGKLTDVRFGVVEYDPNDTAYLFVNGNPTKIMPTSGVANYNGQALVTGNSPKFEENPHLLGTSKFTADFGAKTLNGTLNIDKLKPISVQANILGNDFKGSASSAEFSTKADVAGKFYGENAKELGGIFTDSSAVDDDKSWGGAFGASK